MIRRAEKTLNPSGKREEFFSVFRLLNFAYPVYCMPAELKVFLPSHILQVTAFQLILQELQIKTSKVEKVKI